MLQSGDKALDGLFLAKQDVKALAVIWQFSIKEG